MSPGSSLVDPRPTFFSAPALPARSLFQPCQNSLIAWACAPHRSLPPWFLPPMRPGPWSLSRCRTSASKACSGSSPEPCSPRCRCASATTTTTRKGRPRSVRCSGLVCSRMCGCKPVAMGWWWGWFGGLLGFGLWGDVGGKASGNVLVVVVQERPTIADVNFAGTREFDKDTLKKTMRDIGLADGRPYDKALTDRAEQELKRQYINRSLYGAEVVTTVTPIERNRVNLTFTVVEGEPARIRELRIVGNQAFSESALKGLFDQDTGGWLSWYTKSDRYSRAK